MGTDWLRNFLALMLCCVTTHSSWAHQMAHNAQTPHAKAVHLKEAQLWLSPSTQWEPPRSVDEADDAVASGNTFWQTVTLPHSRQRNTFSAAPTEASTPKVRWYRMEIPADALVFSPQGPRLYIPRWQTLGTLGIYVNGHLTWQSRGSRVWVSFNSPVWVDLGGIAQAGQALTIHVRMATAPGVGGALSSLWVGPAEQLRLGWRVRSLLQTELLTYIRGANLVLGLLSLIVWISRRRHGETGFLWFFFLALSHACATLYFLPDADGTHMHDDWFSWLTVAGSLGASVFAFLLLCRLQHHAYPRLTQALLAYAITVALALLPPWSPPHATMLPLLRLLQIPAALPLLGIALVGAWRLRAKSHIVLAGVMLSLFPLWLHDLAMQRFRVSLEHIYVTPYLYTGVIIMFLFMSMRRYQHTFTAAERANALLGERLAAQERELKQTHERLRAAEREQTLMQERQRLMREMHDGVGSSLISALSLVTGVQPNRPTPVDVAQVLRECIDDLKISIDSLDPVDADLLALLAGLRFRMGQRLADAGVSLNWHTDDVPPLPWLDPKNALHVLRILQETLTNIIKHSGATEITVKTREAPSPLGGGIPGVKVSIEDNGLPFAAPATSYPGRRGVANIRSRARALGAHCAWIPHAHGTVFTLWLPLDSTSLSALQGPLMTTTVPASPTKPPAEKALARSIDRA